MEEIIRRLRSRPQSSLDYLKESMPVKGIDEAEEDEEDTLEYEEEIQGENEVDTSSEEEDTPPEEDNSEDMTEPDEDKKTTKKSPNPLDNPYAINYQLGQEVSLIYANGTTMEMKGIIEGYDKEGFYRIKWDNGMTMNGFTDISLIDMVVKEESKCVCGGTEFVNESNQLVCDKCGRVLLENSDSLTAADKKRPIGKKLIRSEAHPVSTSAKPDISESIRKAFSKKKLTEESEEYSVFNKLHTLKGEFWTKLSELVDDIEDLGYEVVDYNNEYVVIAIEEDDEGDSGELQVPIGGTSRTMTLDFDRARFYAVMDIDS